MTDEARRPGAGRWIFIGILLLALGVSLALNAGLAAGLWLRGGGSGVGGEGGKDEFPNLAETWSYGQGEAKVARIAVDGLIFRGGEEGLFGGGDMVESVLRQIRAATHDEDIRGILLEVDSPGGGVTPSDEIYDALRRFRASGTDRKVVVFVRDLAASGGYYVSMASDFIVAEPTAIIGSIGVIMESVNWNELTKKIGVDATTIKAGENKDLLNPFRPVDPEHVRILQTLVDDMHGRFRGLVAEGRRLSPEQVKDLADGTVFTARDAKEKGLVDEIGYWEDAVKQMAGQLGRESVRVVRYEEEGSVLDRLFAIRAPAVLRGLAGAAGARPMYLWRP